MASLSSLLETIACILLFSFINAQSQTGFENQLRGYCRSQKLGSVCDQDVNKLCQYPQLAWICQRQKQEQRGKSNERGTTPAGATTAGAATTTPGPTVVPTSRTRRPRRKHTTRPTQAPVTERSQPTKSPISKKFILTPEQVSTIQVTPRTSDEIQRLIEIL